MFLYQSQHFRLTMEMLTSLLLTFYLKCFGERRGENITVLDNAGGCYHSR